MGDNKASPTPAVPSDSTFSAALPYNLTAPPTATQSIIIRRLTSVGTVLALLYLLPIPRPAALLTSTPVPTPLFAKYPFIPSLLDSVFSNAVMLNTLIFAYHLALHTTPIIINHKSIPTQWLMPGASVVVALAAGAEDTWVRTNLLWDLVLVLWVAGWKLMSVTQREAMRRWVGGILGGMVVQNVLWGEGGLLWKNA